MAKAIQAEKERPKWSTAIERLRVEQDMIDDMFRLG